MANLTPRDKKTLRIASIGIGIYLAIFCGWRVWGWMEKRRTDYRQLVRKAEDMKVSLLPYPTRAETAARLMEQFHMDPAKLNKATVVAEASSAIQRAAASGGVVLGPIRESSGRAAAHELATVQLQGSGQVTAVMEFLSRLQTLGYPILIDSVQVGAQPGPPGMIKLTLTLVILDFETWKSTEVPHA